MRNNVNWGIIEGVSLLRMDFRLETEEYSRNYHYMRGSWQKFHYLAQNIQK